MYENHRSKETGKRRNGKFKQFQSLYESKDYRNEAWWFAMNSV